MAANTSVFLADTFRELIKHLGSIPLIHDKRHLIKDQILSSRVWRYTFGITVLRRPRHEDCLEFKDSPATELGS